MESNGLYAMKIGYKPVTIRSGEMKSCYYIKCQLEQNIRKSILFQKTMKHDKIYINFTNIALGLT